MNMGGTNTNDVIRFNIDTPGFWDPYSAYIDMEVSIKNNNDVY